MLLIGLDMLEAKRSPTQESHVEAAEAALKEDAGIVPLGIPMLAGPGAITSVMVLVGQARQQWQMVAILGSIFITAAICYLVLGNSDRVARALGETGVRILVRIMGLLLVALAVQYFVNGMADLGVIAKPLKLRRKIDARRCNFFGNLAVSPSITSPFAISSPENPMRLTAEATAATSLLARYKTVRQATRQLCSPLSPEDMMVQSCPEASPVKWHLAHTSWFFETFVLREFAAGYQPFHPEFRWLFNSYYNSLGDMPEKKLRSSFSRPPLDAILAYRNHVDAAMIAKDAASAGG